MEVWLEVFFWTWSYWRERGSGGLAGGFYWDVKVLEVGASPSDTEGILIFIFIAILIPLGRCFFLDAELLEVER